MSFLKFLKKGKKDDMPDELDLPPAPPPLGDFHEENIITELPDFDRHDKEDLPEFGFEENDFKGLGNEAIDLPNYAPVQQPMPILPVRAPPQRMQEIENQDIPEMPFQNEKKAVRMPMETSIYVRVDRFKAAVGSINEVRSDLKKSEEALIKFESMRSIDEKAINRIRSSLDDLQKKFVFVDKTVFKGE